MKMKCKYCGCPITTHDKMCSQCGGENNNYIQDATIIIDSGKARGIPKWIRFIPLGLLGFFTVGTMITFILIIINFIQEII